MKQSKHVKITHVYIVVTVAVIVMAVIVGFSMKESSRSLSRLQESTEDYINVQESISSLREASDYLTDECRSYVVSGEVSHIKNYFTEANVTKRRDKAVEVITEYNESEYIQQSLEKSLQFSNELMETELYAMKLSTAGHDIHDAQVDAYLKDVNLTEEDKALDSDAKIQKATSMVFDDNYENYKTSIRQGVFDSLDNLIKDTRSDQRESYAIARNVSMRENMLFFMTLVLMGIVLISTAFGVIFPLKKSAELIQKNEKLSTKGSYEYSMLAEAFNRMFDKNQKHSELLSYEATHDELTGLYNRKLFEEKRREMYGTDSAMILFDIDHFKEVNDTYGHEIGDKILKKVSSAIQSSFRTEDYACRIGGDEFAVLMVQMHPEIGGVIRRKIELVTEKIKKDDGLPDTTLSIGAAFSEDSNDPEDLFRNADAALYKVKNMGRNGFAFFKDPDESK